MSLEQEIFTALRTLVADRVYPLILPPTPTVPVTPAITYQFVSEDAAVDICGSGSGDTDDTRFQVDIYSTTRPTARDLRLLVIAKVATMPTPTRRVGGFEDYDSDLKLFRCSLDFTSYASSS